MSLMLSLAVRLVAISCAVTFAPLAYAQASATPSNNHIVPTGRAYLLYPGQNGFDDLVLKFFPTIASAPDYPQIRLKSVLLVNGSHLSINAFSIQWVLASSSGAQTTRYTTYLPEARGVVLSSATRVALKAGDTALITPIMHWESEGPIAPPPSMFSALLSRSDQGALVSQANAITARIDGVVFGSKRFVGQDQSGLAEAFTCDINGSIDEASSLLVASGSDASLTSQLRKDSLLEKADVADASCNEARGREAQRLMRVASTVNQQAAILMIQQQARLQRVALNRVSVHASK